MTGCKTVLIVEHDHETRVHLRKILEEAGHFVVSATSGHEALALLDKMSAPSLILFSPDLPSITPAYFLEVLRSSEKHKSVSVSQLVSKDEGLMDGMCCKISRSVQKEELLLALSNC